MLRSGLLFLAIANCAAPEPEQPVEIKRPNTIEACQRAVVCGVVDGADIGACIACLEAIDPAVLQELEKTYGEIPPLEVISCELVKLVVNSTNIGECINERWHGEYE